MDATIWDTSDPAFLTYITRLESELIPKLRSSDATVTLVPTGDADVKFSTEIGLSLMMNKPIVLLIRPGMHVPPKLAAIADEMVEIDLHRPQLISLAVNAAMDRLAARGLL